jgi:ribosome-associated protein
MAKVKSIVEFTLEGEFIHLIQLLKATDFVSSGGEAQLVVTDGLVKYNGQTDLRKRLKVRKGDIVSFEGQVIKVI